MKLESKAEGTLENPDMWKLNNILKEAVGLRRNPKGNQKIS